MAAALIPLAGVFQVFDGIQVVAGGILRGLGETRVAMLVNLLGYWCSGCRSATCCGIRCGLGPGRSLVGTGARAWRSWPRSC